jgi:uncharacterized membrane protein YeaQ/YmgE (transglycosylase-associated protein family)
MFAGILAALAIVVGGPMGVLMVVVLGALGFVLGALLSGEHRSFRRTRRRRR